MKTFNYFILYISVFVLSCTSLPKDTNIPEKTVVIANEDLQYEIIITDVGFTNYLNTMAKSKGFYSQNYLENKNRMYVTIWNSRMRKPSQFNPSIYENNIDYNPNINYGYEVNYKLFNYFEFAQQKYRMILR